MQGRVAPLRFFSGFKRSVTFAVDCPMNYNLSCLAPGPPLSEDPPATGVHRLAGLMDGSFLLHMSKRPFFSSAHSLCDRGEQRAAAVSNWGGYYSELLPLPCCVVFFIFIGLFCFHWTKCSELNAFFINSALYNCNEFCVLSTLWFCTDF